LLAQQPDLPAGHRLIPGGGGPAGAALAHQRGAGQVVVVDSALRMVPSSDRQVFTVCGKSRSASMAAFHAPGVLASRSPSGMFPKAGRIRFSTFLQVPYSEVGCWSFEAGHHFVAT
jgi:hypothetical protein